MSYVSQFCYTYVCMVASRQTHFARLVILVFTSYCDFHSQHHTLLILVFVFFPLLHLSMRSCLAEQQQEKLLFY